MNYMSPGDILRCHKGAYDPQFTTLVENIKDFPWIDTYKIRGFCQKETLDTREDLLTLTNIP